MTKELDEDITTGEGAYDELNGEPEPTQDESNSAEAETGPDGMPAPRTRGQAGLSEGRHIRRTLTDSYTYSILVKTDRQTDRQTTAPRIGPFGSSLRHLVQEEK